MVFRATYECPDRVVWEHEKALVHFNACECRYCNGRPHMQRADESIQDAAPSKRRGVDIGRSSGRESSFHWS